MRQRFFPMSYGRRHAGQIPTPTPAPFPPVRRERLEVVPIGAVAILASATDKTPNLRQLI